MAVIKLYNTLTREKEVFTPITPGQVGFYSCGPTVYFYPHIGNMRAYVLSDSLRRMFEYNGLKVKQIINITDVGHLVSDEDEGEDKVEKEARAEGKSAEEIIKFYTDAFMADLADLNIETADTIFPRATLHIPEQIAIIKTLEAKGFTYQTSDGLYFDTAKYPKYTELAKLDLAGQKAGARVAVNPEKKNPTDFALWKFSPKTGDARLQEWESLWGLGFPGWAIECSAMSSKYLGNHFDIHTGGIDHIPVHHTNERAQSECANGEFVNYWLHNNFITVDGEKMSKSLGNIYRLADLTAKGFSPLAYRYWLLTASYHRQVNFTFDALTSAETAYKRLINTLAEIKNKNDRAGKIEENYKAKFTEAINDDLDTPTALVIIWDLLKDENIVPADKLATVLDFDRFLGLRLAEALEPADLDLPEEVKNLVAQREIARQNKDYTKSDELREEIKRLGYTLDDTDNGQKIRLN